MATTVQMAGNNIGGIIQGNYGTYQQASDGTFTVDTRDVPTLLALGASYISKRSASYTTPLAPAAASATAYIASTTMSNGTVAIAAQPDVMRPAQLVITALASPGPSAGSVAIAYTGNDGVATTDTFSAVTVGVTPVTFQTSKGVAHFTSVTNSALAGGTAALTLGSVAILSVPVDPGAKDFTETREAVASGVVSNGTVSATILGSITPTSAPNGTLVYSFGYTFLAGEQ